MCVCATNIAAAVTKHEPIIDPFFRPQTLKPTPNLLSQIGKALQFSAIKDIILAYSLKYSQNQELVTLASEQFKACAINFIQSFTEVGKPRTELINGILYIATMISNCFRFHYRIKSGGRSRRRHSRTAANPFVGRKSRSFRATCRSVREIYRAVV